MDYFFGIGDAEIALIIQIVGLASLIWGVYALVKGRICLRFAPGDGWVIREESPKTFWFETLSYIVIGVILVVASTFIM